MSVGGLSITRIMETSPIRVSYSTRWNASVVKMGVVDVDIHVSSHLKEELAWAADKHLHVISIIMLFKTPLYVVRYRFNATLHSQAVHTGVQVIAYESATPRTRMCEE